MANATKNTARNFLAELKPFKTGGSFSAMTGATTWFGYLPQEHVAQYKEDREVGIVYTVMSYSTPIAWVLADGTVRIPDVSYSRTTSAQQNQCRAWLPKQS